METGEALKRFRNAFGLNQRDVAETVGIFPQSYSRYEKGQFPPTVPMLLALSKKYNVTTDYLLGLSDEPRPAPDNQTLIDALLGCRSLIQTALDDKVKTE